jgi:RNA polymerase sigma factor (sigma-70 family)
MMCVGRNSQEKTKVGRSHRNATPGIERTIWAIAVRHEPDERASFAKLYVNYRQPVHDFLRRRDGVHTVDELEELVQEVFLRAWRDRHSFRGDSSVNTHLCGIAKNVLREELRAARRRPRVTVGDELNVTDPADNLGDLEKRIDDQELIGAIELAILGLTHRQREAIRLVIVEGHSQVEAARQAAATSAKAIQHRLAAGLKYLRHAVALENAK